MLHHHPTGRIFRSILSVDAAVTSLTLEPIERTFFGLVSVARPTVSGFWRASLIIECCFTVYTYLSADV